MLRSSAVGILKDLNVVFPLLGNTLYMRYKGIFRLYQLPTMRVFFSLNAL